MISIRLNRRDVCHNLAMTLACVWCHVVGAQALCSWDRMTPNARRERAGRATATRDGSSDRRQRSAGLCDEWSSYTEGVAKGKRVACRSAACADREQEGDGGSGTSLWAWKRKPIMKRGY